MENCLLYLDLIPNIIKYSNWTTLQQLKQVNNFFYSLSKEEIYKRLKSKHPFGETSLKLSIVTKDINLESITCIIDEERIFVPKNKYTIFWVRNILMHWFLYSFVKREFILTNRLFQAIIRVINRKTNNIPIDEFHQTLIFQYENGETYLENIY